MNDIIIYERLHSIDVMHLVIFPWTRSTVYYFDKTRFAQMLISLFHMSNQVIQCQFSYSDVKDEYGEHLHFEINSKHVLEICNKIANHQLHTSKLINMMVNLFGHKNYVLYNKKFIREKITQTINCLKIIVWLRDFKKQMGKGKITFVPKPLYSIVLKNYSQENFAIDIKTTGSSVYAFQMIASLVRQCIIVCGMTIFPLLAAGLQVLLCKKKHIYNNPMIGVSYSGIGMAFNMKERCDFHFLLWDKLPFNKILMYFRRTDVPVDKSGMKLLQEKKISLLSCVFSRHFAQYMPIYVPSLRQSYLITKHLLKIFFCIVLEICRNGSQGFSPITSALKFIVSYARAYDFFENCNIKITIDREDQDLMRIAERCALHDLGGTSVSFQISNLIMPNVMIATGAEVMFTFGPYYNKVFMDSGSTNAVFLSSGYVTDYARYHVRENSKNIRLEIEKNGAQFIVCYFDENSSDDRWSIIENKTSLSVYTELLNMVIRDTTFGLICSPKKPNNLLTRMPELKNVMERAQQTGRCVFMGGNYHTKYYPTEPAQAADLSIALLLGGTVGLECFLSEVRTVYLDLEGCNSYPEYLQGFNKIVFTSMESLFQEISEYRKNISNASLFGNKALVPFGDERDPFRDGKASERIACFLQGLLTGYEQKITKTDILQQNIERYANQYGKHVVQYNK